MITEDYVNFEVAKLLEEKGFDEQTRFCFRGDGNILHNDGSYVGYPGYYPRPTLQMARKWLRLKHNIYIDAHLSFAEDPEAYPAVYYVYILDAKSGNSLLEKAAHIGELNPLIDVKHHNVPINFDSPEQAAETAIKYCLENLI